MMNVVNLDVQNNHMKHRCYFMYALCGLSLHTWYNNPFFNFNNNDNNNSTLYYKNWLLASYLI